MAFSVLQARANSLVESGQLMEAQPLLKEIIKRVEGNSENDFDLAFPYFLVGTSHIQNFISTGKESELDDALKWYDKLEKEYPSSSHLKRALKKKVDIYRALKRNDEAIKLMQRMLSGGYSFALGYTEEIKLLRDLTQTYYSLGKLKEGLPYFGRLMNESRDNEDKVLGAAASFESLVEAKRLDDAIKVLPYLTFDARVRYLPRLNVALLKASDTMVEQERFTDAALLLNLIKTTDIMIQYHERLLAQKKATLEQRTAFGASREVIDRLNQEIKNLEANLKQLRDLPTMKDDLLVRRARNFTKTGRPYEAFWMFFDLKNEMKGTDRSEFYHYAAMSSARKIGKTEAATDLGREYRKTYPDGEYYSDTTAALITELQAAGKVEEMLPILVDFLNSKPEDPFSTNFISVWAGELVKREDYRGILWQCDEWISMHTNPKPIFEDGLYYWSGLATVQLSDFVEAIKRMDVVLKEFPTSLYAEDALLRKGIAQFYLQEFGAARVTLTKYTQDYPRGVAIDQAYYFLGEVESYEGYVERALKNFRKCDKLTKSQEMHDAASFRIGNMLELLERYTEMRDHFAKYIEQYGEKGRITSAYFELGRAYEFLSQPTQTLTIYRDAISKYAGLKGDHGVDTLVEGYAEKYDLNKTKLERTVAFLDQMKNDAAFREKLLTDRGFLFEQFYLDPNIEQTLYNQMRNHPSFGPDLMDDLSPLNDITQGFYTEWQNFPKQTPEDYFRDQLAKHVANEDRTAETRMLMGLFRTGVEIAPQQAYDKAFIQQATPRVLLYVADYSREKNLNFSIETWTELLNRFPDDDATIVAYMRLADVSVEHGDNSGALIYLDAIATNFPGSPQVPAVILRQGEILTEMGEGKTAREKYQYILRVPDWRGVLHAKALLQTGDSFMAEGQFDAAHGFFERTFLGYSHFSEIAGKAYLADADALVKMGQVEDARATLNEALEMLKDAAPEELYSSLQQKLQTL